MKNSVYEENGLESCYSSLVAKSKGGTLVFDAVAGATLYLQGFLLPLADVNASGVRCVFSTNSSLEELMDAELFRQDLYYLLSRYRIEIPPLRERKEDIPLLVHHFLQEARQTYEKMPAWMGEKAMAHLLNYHYPGNVRELRAIVFDLYIRCAGEEIPVALVEQTMNRLDIRYQPLVKEQAL